MTEIGHLTELNLLVARFGVATLCVTLGYVTPGVVGLGHESINGNVRLEDDLQK